MSLYKNYSVNNITGNKNVLYVTNENRKFNVKVGQDDKAIKK